MPLEDVFNEANDEAAAERRRLYEQWCRQFDAQPRPREAIQPPPVYEINPDWVDAAPPEQRHPYRLDDEGRWVPIEQALAGIPPRAREAEPYNFETTKFSDQLIMKTTKKKEKKTTKKVEFTEEQKSEAKVRVSVFGSTFPTSTPDQWIEYDGAGWSHTDEISRFVDCYKKCHFNKKWHPMNKLSRTVQGFSISLDEVKKKGWVKCQHSEYWAKPDELVDAFCGNRKLRIASHFIQSGDYFACTLSKKIYHRSSRVNVHGSDTYGCVSKEEVAKSNLIGKCDVCGHLVESNRIQERDLGRERPRVMACTSCYNREMGRHLIRAHNFAEYPAPINKKIEYWRGYDHGQYRRFKKVEDVGIRLFGVEVETEMSMAACEKAGIDRLVLARSVKETLGSDFVMIKEDGSLSLNGHYGDDRTGSMYAGFEIVSAPADIDVHRQRWGLLEKMKHFDALRAWNTETCGLHVHVSKDALTTLQIGRILMLMTHNKNKKFIAKVAGRGENKYCKAFHKEKLSDGIQYGEAEVRNGVEYIQASFQLPRSDDARRQAVNITNPKTIEFRIFRGTVHPRHIIRNIEFADAVCSFCHPGSRSLKELTDYTNLVYYIAENRKTYPLLAEWMESPDVGILTHRKNSYGPKDTRGTQRPDVVEVLNNNADKVEPVEDVDGIGIPAPAPLIYPQLHDGGLMYNQAGFVQHNPFIDPAMEAARVARANSQFMRIANRIALANAAAADALLLANAVADLPPPEPDPAEDEAEDGPVDQPW